MRRRAALLVVLLFAAATLAGCGTFWDWLAGRPVTPPSTPAQAGEAGEAGEEEEPSGEPEAGTDEEPAPAPNTPEPGDEAPEGEGSHAGDGSGGNDGEQAGAGGVGEPPDPGRCGAWAQAPPAEPGTFQEVRIEPVDQSGRDASFSAFRAQLLEAVRQRDAGALLATVGEDVKNSFGGDGGIEEFRKKWGLNARPEDSPVWTVVADIFDLGGIFEDEEHTYFTAPYVYALYDTELDPFSHYVVTGAGVNVRAGPSLDAEPVSRVSYLVVRALPQEEPPPTIELDGREYCWVKIGLPSGDTGYMAGKFLWSPVGYRASFRKTEAGWRLRYLLAGD